ncbi:MAG TPA: DUF5372 family protein [Armatimonadota bacterium]|nr:DUF5372 family protein [Armatimonadota bacterium]
MRQTVRITHPFHPQSGREYPLVTCRRNWGEDRAYYHDDNGQLVSLPGAWTSVCAPDPVVVLSAGQSAFRVQDLMDLARLIEELKQGGDKR